MRGQLPDVRFNLITLANEVDLAFAQREAEWNAFRAFYREGKDCAARLWPGVPVGTSATLYGLEGPAREPLRLVNAISDVVVVTYYPIDEQYQVQPPERVGQDIADLLSVYPDRKNYFAETGYPTSAFLGSSELQQARFIHEIFLAWDRHAAAIPHVTFSWLSDSPPATLRALTDYYQLDSRPFQEFLGTLGLRTALGSGSDKLGFQQLREEAGGRGWSHTAPASAPGQP